MRKHHRQLNASPGASGPHDFTVRSCCSSDNTPRPSHPAANVRDDRETPLLWLWDARSIVVICPTAQEQTARRAICAWRVCAPLSTSFRGDAQASSPESITTIVSMDSGPAPCGASRNDDRTCAANGEQLALLPTLRILGWRRTERAFRSTAEPCRDRPSPSRGDRLGEMRCGRDSSRCSGSARDHRAGNSASWSAKSPS